MTAKNHIKLSAKIILYVFLTHFPQLSYSSNSIINSRACFTPNKGQVIDTEGNVRPDLLFTADYPGMKVFIKNTGISYVLSKPAEDYIFLESLDELMPKTSSFKTHRIDLEFFNCNPVSVTESDELQGYKNFYFPHCPEGLNNVKSYRTLSQKNIYNNTNLVYKANSTKGLKYDLVVNPGGNPNDIALKYSGADKISVEKGVLSIETSLGEILEVMPKVYQNINEKLIDITAEYILDDNNIIKFKLGTFDPKHALIIDPWVTYFGGSNNENGLSVTTDPSGNVIFTGLTYSTNFPTLGAFQTTQPAGSFVAKMDANGNLLWSTYYGGNFNDRANGICTDANGDIYFTGESWSANFPLVTLLGQTSHLNTHPGIVSGKIAAFLVKLNPAGQPIWGTFYGDPVSGLYTNGQDVTVDQSGNVLLTGSTAATNNIATAGTFQQTYAGVNIPGYFWGDVYVAKFNSTGVRQWGTYVGGSALETAGGISCDASNNIYIGGKTLSNDFPVSAGAYMPTYRNNSDAFLFKLNTNGQRVWATYYGGNSGDEGLVVQVDLSDDVYIAGRTLSRTGLGSPGSPFPTKTPGTLNADAFIAKFSSSGTRLWGSYLGGQVAAAAGGGAAEYATGLAIDANNNVIVSGDTYSMDFPVTSCAQQTVFLGTEDQFITTFSSSGTLICSGYIGSGGPTALNNETINGAGGCIVANGSFVYLTASSENAYPVTTNAYQYTGAGNVDVTVAKLCVLSCGLPNIIADFNASKTTICTGENIGFTLSNGSCSQTGTSYQWSFQGGNPATSTLQNPTNVSFNTAGTYNVKVVITTPCGKDSVEKNAYINVTGVPATINILNHVSCNGHNDGSAEVVTPAGQYSFVWSNGQTNSTATTLSAGTYSVTVSNDQGCSSIFSTTITEPAALNVVASITHSISCNSFSDGEITAACSGGTAPYYYLWNNGQTNMSTSGLTIGNYSLIVTDNNGCTGITNIQLSEPPVLIASIPFSNAICDGQSVSINVSVSGGTPNFSYSWNTNTTTQSISVSPTATNTYSVVATDANGCTALATTNIMVHPLPLVNFVSDYTEGCPELCVNFMNTGTPSQNFYWNFGNGTTSVDEEPEVCYKNPGNYNVSLTITDANGCSNTSTINNYITVYPLPLAAFSANPNPADINEPVYFKDESQGATKWNWTFGDVLNSISSIQHPTFIYTDSGYYTVQLIVENMYGCIDETSLSLRIKPEFAFYAPNTFTPNNDGKNDFFIPKGTGISNNNNNYEFYIFDRWGNQIFVTNNPSIGWNGKVNNTGNLVQIDTYVWLVKFIDVNGERRSYNGHVNVLK